MDITIIGCGTMGKGVAKRLSPTHQLHLYNQTFDKAEKLEQSGFGKAYKDCKKAVDKANIVILAVKPQNLKEAARELAPNLKKGQILVSLLAGTTIDTLHRCFMNTKIVRMMPNLALLYGEGIIGLSSEKMSQKDQDTLIKTFEPLGKVYWLPENKINGLTALTGSGPAFVFALIEAMIDSGIAMGFHAKDARSLVYQMLQGSLTLLTNTDEHPGELKWQIASPQGTTIAGLQKLEELALRGGIMNTFLAAFERAKTLHVS